jgi:chaperone BCS1
VGIPHSFRVCLKKLSFVSVDDSYLQRAASAIPKHGLFLIEDIDCAFPSRDEDEEEDEPNLMTMMGGGRRARQVPPGHRSRSMVTLSGLLNVIDGIGSEEGKLFFATVR